MTPTHDIFFRAKNISPAFIEDIIKAARARGVEVVRVGGVEIMVGVSCE